MSRNGKCHVDARSMRSFLTASLSSCFEPELQIRSLAAGTLDKVDCTACNAFVAMLLECATDPVHVWNSATAEFYMQVSMTAHQTADQVQQKGKRIGENVRQQVLPISAKFVLCSAVSATAAAGMTPGDVVQWDEVDQKFKVSEHASVAMKVTYCNAISSCCSAA